MKIERLICLFMSFYYLFKGRWSDYFQVIVTPTAEITVSKKLHAYLLSGIYIFSIEIIILPFFYITLLIGKAEEFETCKPN